MTNRAPSASTPGRPRVAVGRRICTAGVVAWLAMLAAGRAEAYPQFQFSSGTTRCAQCHFSPAGGGLLTDWGRGEAGDTLSRGGDGSFAHGAWEPPKWLALGADVRAAALVNAVRDPAAIGPEYAAFPMLADVYLRPRFGEALSLYVAAGLGGSVRRATPDPASIAVSREHYLMWRPQPTGIYLRAGRFYAPYGLRVAEHVAFVRRYEGFGVLEETYGVSGGMVEEGWELHVTALTPALWRPVGDRGSGGAALFEKRLGGIASVGAQTRVTVGPEFTRVAGGAIGKVYLERPKLLLMGQADVIRKSYVAVAHPDAQLALYAGVTWFPVRGLMVGGWLERFDEALAVEGLDRDAANLQVNFFPRAHFEVSLTGREQFLGNTYGDGAARFVMLQLHYYL